MNPPNFERVLDLFAQARELPTSEQAAFLAAACPEDEAVRREVGSLLQAHGAAADFLDAPVFADGMEVLHATEAIGSLQAGTELGECRILSLIGEGGMGEVYLAEDTKLERRVAVKLLKRRLDDANLARRFRHERKVLAALTHPNIARLYGGGTTAEGRSYLVMEYVEGERLDRFCDARGLNVGERTALFRKVCAAVAYAHQNLVVHRDLKPANIRVTPEGEPKLLDFGIAKLLDSDDAPHADPTATMQGAMTPEYASPEQLKGETITTTSDVYSLGVVLYELLCGQRPFAHLKGRRPDELARAICEEEPPRPSTVVGRLSLASATKTRSVKPATPFPTRLATLRRQLDGDLDNIVARALHKEPGRRYPSVLALSEDLRRHDEGLPVRARRDTFAYRTSKFVGRNKLGVVAGTLVLLALTGGLAATIWQAHAADQQRDRARVALANAEAAQRQSELDRKQTQQINDFLQKILGSANTRRMGKDAKIIQALDAASADMDRTLANEPEVLAQIHRTLGSTYNSLALLPAAEAHFRAALTLFRQLYGTDDPRSVEAEIYLARVAANLSHHEEAVQILPHAIRWLRQHPEGNEIKMEFTASNLPANQISLGKALTSLGYSYNELARLPEARQALEEATAIHARTTGTNTSEYASNLVQLGVLEEKEGDFSGAAEMCQRAQTIMSKIAPDQPDLVIAEANQCLFLLEAGRFTEASALIEQTTHDCRRIFGEKGNVVSDFISYLSEVVDFQKGEFAKVAASGKEVLDRLTAFESADDTNVVTAGYLLGASLTLVGRASEGESYLRAALVNFNPIKHAMFPMYGNAEIALGNCLMAQKRYPEAERLFQTGLAGLEKRLGSQNDLTLQARQRLHDLYLAWNKPIEAARYEARPTAQTAPAP